MVAFVGISANINLNGLSGLNGQPLCGQANFSLSAAQISPGSAHPHHHHHHCDPNGPQSGQWGPGGSQFGQFGPNMQQPGTDPCDQMPNSACQSTYPTDGQNCNQSDCQPGSAQSMINHGNQLVQKGEQDIQNGDVAKGMREINHGMDLINRGTSQLAAQQPTQSPSGDSNGQSSDPLNLLSQIAQPLIGDLTQALGGGGGCGSPLASLFGGLGGGSSSLLSMAGLAAFIWPAAELAAGGDLNPQPNPGAPSAVGL